MPETGLAVLLRPDREVVRFTGRREELELLRAWCASDEPRSVRLIVGPSGVGKSRLAQQVAAEWGAGGALWRPVAPGDEGTAVARSRAVSSGRLLLVVDDAENRTGAGLASLMDALVADPGPVKVLLVAGSLGEWWDRLADEAPDARTLLEAAPIRLGTPLTESVPDAQVAIAAVADFAREMCVAEPGGVDVERVGLRLPVLLIHAAALLSVVRGADQPDWPAEVVLDTGVLGDLLDWEARYWRRKALAQGLPDDETLIRQVIGAATLTGAGTAAEIQAVLARLPQLSGEAQEQRAGWARWLSGLYPSGPDGRVGLLQPQMLAQAQVAGLLADDPVLARALLRQLPPGQAEHALTMLAHAAAHQREAAEVMAGALQYDLPHLALPAATVATKGHPEVAEVLCSALATATAAPEELAQIALDLPHPSPILAEANLVATLRARETVQLDPGPQAGAEWDERAAQLLAEVGRGNVGRGRPGAGATDGAAVGGWGRNHPEFAASLSNLAVRLHQIDRFDEAVAAEQAAIAVYRTLTGRDPGRYRPELASSLTNLGVWFSAAGRPADAIKATAEAASAFRELVSAGSVYYQADLATALTNMGIWQAEQGHVGDALSAEDEAVGIFRELAEADPGRYRPDLATALTNLGIWFSLAGRPDDAAPVEHEAVTLRRALAAADPGRYRIDLATSLNNLIITYRELERPADALAPSKEVVVSYRELAAVDPDSYRPELARALANVGALHHELGQPGAALASAKEAVSIRRRLADADPAGHLLGLAHSLETLASILSALGHEDEAAKASEEAATIANEADEASGNGRD
jgi:tetratricopeptide (TPR) repeat protein